MCKPQTEAEWEEAVSKLAAADAFDGTCPFSGSVPVEMDSDCIAKGFEHCVECRWWGNTTDKLLESRHTTNQKKGETVGRYWQHCCNGHSDLNF